VPEQSQNTLRVVPARAVALEGLGA